MKNRTKIVILFLVVILATIIILELTNKINITDIGNEKNNSNVIKNTNENVIKDAKLKGLDLTNISLSYVKNVGSTFSVTLKNNTNEVINLESFNITLKDENNNTIAVLVAYVGGNIDPKQENSIKVTAKEDISKATSVEYSEQ